MNTVPEIIWSQISRNTKMCLAASNPTGYDNELRFFVRVDNQRRYIKIKLNGKDLYDCEQVLVRKGKHTAKFYAEDVFCEDLDEVVFTLGSTRGASFEELANRGVYPMNASR